MKPKKKINHNVTARLSNVAVALMSGGTPRAMNSVVMVISGIPTSKGIPTGIALIAATIEAVTITTKN
jgi:uncharacterized protein involved in propanediol utilization